MVFSAELWLDKLVISWVAIHFHVEIRPWVLAVFAWSQIYSVSPRASAEEKKRIAVLKQISKKWLEGAVES